MNNAEVTVGTLQDSDIQEISQLQHENLRANLTPDQMQDGYLSIGCSDEQFRAFDDDLGVVVVRAEGRVVGYCCVSSATFNAPFPILDQIVSGLSGYKIPGSEEKPTEVTTSIYGPACIEKDFRGQGVLQLLFEQAVTLSIAAGYAFCFSFVSVENQRSLKAHLKLPLEKVGTVSFNENEYRVIGCKL